VVAVSTSHRIGSLLALFVLASTAACFDSDEKFEPRAGSTTGTVDPTTTSGSSSTTGTPDPTTGEPDISCRDAVQCIQQCAFDLITDPGIEPDLGCFLDCEEQLTVREAYHLLRLGNCAAAECEMRDECMSGDTDGGGSSSSSGGDDGGGLIDPCLQCVFLEMTNTDPMVCVEFHELCNEEMVE
jgi:hypothetical protein